MSYSKKMARIIQYLDENYQEQPGLEQLAEIAGLSPYHFHRQFTSWVGVTPKDFVQSLTMAHARSCLLDGESVLEASYSAGLSGPGRLHDLSITMEAVTPGEIKSGGAGLTFEYGEGDSPFGRCMIVRSERGITSMRFIDDFNPVKTEEKIRAAWPRVDLKRNDRDIQRLLDGIFKVPAEGQSTLELRLWVRGSQFRTRVWKALLEVPPGSLTTYGRLAEIAGVPGAARAVGTAMAINPIVYLIPCHRVIRETGVIGNYAYGRGLKRTLIAWEGAAQAAADFSAAVSSKTVNSEGTPIRSGGPQ